MAILEYRLEPGGMHLPEEIPVRLRIGNREMLHFHAQYEQDDMLGGRWLPLPLPFFAIFGEVSLRAAEDLGCYALELDDIGHALLFKMAGADVLVLSTMNELTAQISFRYLLDTWSAFANEVESMVTSRFPDDDYSAVWRLRDVPTERIVAFSWREWFIGHEQCFDWVDIEER